MSGTERDPDIITLSCPSCGGDLHITSDVERFACAHCGQQHLVRRSGGIVSLSPLVEGLHKVNIGVDKTASELAIVRIKGEIEVLESQKNDIDTNTGCCGCAGILSVVIFCIAWALSIGGVMELFGWIGLFLLGCSLEKKYGRERIEIKKTIESKKEELEEHLRTVSIR